MITAAAMGMALLATRCHEEPQKAQQGGRTGDAIGQALERAGWTLVEGVEALRDPRRFAVSRRRSSGG